MGRERDIRIRALRDVLKQNDPGYLVRSKIRWYAKTFGMDPRVVESEVPLEDVWRCWWESRYEELLNGNDHDLQVLEQEREMLSLTPEELAKAQRVEDTQDAETTKELLAAREARGPSVPLPPPSDLFFDPPKAPVKLPEDVDLTFPVDWEDQDALGGMLDGPQS